MPKKYYDSERVKIIIRLYSAIKSNVIFYRVEKSQSNFVHLFGQSEFLHNLDIFIQIIFTGNKRSQSVIVDMEQNE